MKYTTGQIVTLALNFALRTSNTIFAWVGLLGMAAVPIGLLVWLFFWTGGWKICIAGIILFVTNRIYVKNTFVTQEEIKKQILSSPQTTKMFLDSLKTNRKFMQTYSYLFDEKNINENQNNSSGG